MLSKRVRIGVPAAVFLVIWTLTTHGKYSHSGDEPHYLIVAESLLSDGDLDLEDNYREQDYRRFGPETLDAGPHVARTRQGALWSTHDIGVPVVLLPAYAIATRVIAPVVPPDLLRRFRQGPGLFAYSLISLTLVALTAFGAALLLRALARVNSGRRAAVVVLAVTLSPPVMAHAFLVFPETLAFVVVCAVAWLIVRATNDVSVRSAVVVVALVGGLPWLHRKYAVLVFGLLAVLALVQWSWLRRQRPGVLMWLGLLAVLPQVLLHLWTVAAWGTVGGPQMLEEVPFSVANMLTGSLGMLLDRERGLLGYAPIYALAPAAFALSWRASRILLLPIAALFLPLSAFSVWDAGFSPAARFLVPLMPLVALPAVRAMDRSPFRRVAVALLAFQGVIVAIAWSSPRALWPLEEGTNQILDRIPVLGPAWSALLPSIHTGDPAWTSWPALLLVVLVNTVVVRASRRASRAAAGG